MMQLYNSIKYHIIEGISFVFTQPRGGKMTRCYACPRDVFLPTNPNHPPAAVCMICGQAFCKLHGKPFVCRQCFDRMENNNQREVLLAAKTYRSRFGGGIAMTVIGAILLFSAMITGMVAWILSMSIFPLPSMGIAAVAAVILIIIGLSLLCGGVNSIKTAKMPLLAALRNARSQGSTHAGPVSTEQGAWTVNQPRQSSIPPSAFIPSPKNDETSRQQRIPSSAFVPPTQDHAIPSQSRIPSSAFIPSPRDDRKVPSGLTRREVPQEFTKSVQMAPDRICSFCGSPIPTGDESRFCPNCGKAIS